MQFDLMFEPLENDMLSEKMEASSFYTRHRPVPNLVCRRLREDIHAQVICTDFNPIQAGLFW